MLHPRQAEIRDLVRSDATLMAHYTAWLGLRHRLSRSISDRAQWNLAADAYEVLHQDVMRLLTPVGLGGDMDAHASALEIIEEVYRSYEQLEARPHPTPGIADRDQVPVEAIWDLLDRDEQQQLAASAGYKRFSTILGRSWSDLSSGARQRLKAGDQVHESRRISGAVLHLLSSGNRVPIPTLLKVLQSQFRSWSLTRIRKLLLEMANDELVQLGRADGSFLPDIEEAIRNRDQIYYYVSKGPGATGPSLMAPESSDESDSEEDLDEDGQLEPALVRSSMDLWETRPIIEENWEKNVMSPAEEQRVRRIDFLRQVAPFVLWRTRGMPVISGVFNPTNGTHRMARPPKKDYIIEQESDIWDWIERRGKFIKAGQGSFSSRFLGIHLVPHRISGQQHWMVICDFDIEKKETISPDLFRGIVKDSVEFFEKRGSTGIIMFTGSTFQVWGRVAAGDYYDLRGNPNISRNQEARGVLDALYLHLVDSGHKIVWMAQRTQLQQSEVGLDFRMNRDNQPIRFFFALHPLTGLASYPVAPEEVDQFDPWIDAHPENVLANFGEYRGRVDRFFEFSFD